LLEVQKDRITKADLKSESTSLEIDHDPHSN